MKFDENLRELRKERGYSQEELSVKLGVTRQTVSKWENGSAMPDLKKLTELAKFFGVSMDDLLGIEHGSSSSGNNESLEAYIQYTNQHIATLEASRNQERKKIVTTAVVCFSVALCLFFICFLIYSNGIRNELNSLSNNIQFLQSQINGYSYSENINYWESKSDDVTVSFLSIDPEKPYIVNAELKYAPVSYAKGSKVYFSVPKENKGIERLEATEENGEFILTTDIDITVEGEYYFFLDDGNEIVKEELYVYPEDLYCEFNGYENPVAYYIWKQNDFKKNVYYFENLFDTDALYWKGIASTGLVSARFVVENAGKEVFTKDLEISKNDNSKETKIKLSDFSLEINGLSSLRAYVSVIDGLGVNYKHYVELQPFDFDSTEVEVYYGDYNVLIFDIEGRGKVAVGEPADID